MKNRIEGERLRSLMFKYGLSGNDGADLVAKLLHTTRSTVMGWFTKGIPINDFELLTRKLAERK